MSKRHRRRHFDDEAIISSSHKNANDNYFYLILILIYDIFVRTLSHQVYWSFLGGDVPVSSYTCRIAAHQIFSRLRWLKPYITLGNHINKDAAITPIAVMIVPRKRTPLTPITLYFSRWRCAQKNNSATSIGNI